MNKLFILRDRDADVMSFYITNAPKTCQKIANIVDKRWCKNNDIGKWFDFFAEFLKECEKRKVKIQYISDNDIAVAYY